MWSIEAKTLGGKALLMEKLLVVRVLLVLEMMMMLLLLLLQQLCVRRHQRVMFHAEFEEGVDQRPLSPLQLHYLQQALGAARAATVLVECPMPPVFAPYRLVRGLVHGRGLLAALAMRERVGATRRPSSLLAAAAASKRRVVAGARALMRVEGVDSGGAVLVVLDVMRRRQVCIRPVRSVFEVCIQVAVAVCILGRHHARGVGLRHSIPPELVEGLPPRGAIVDDEKGFHQAFAFDFARAEPLEVEAIVEELHGVDGDVHAHREAVALHAAGSVDRVPEEAVARHFHSHNPRVRRPAVHPNAHLHVLAW
mmetsp:Transcript_7699/g.17679  ORF Transcript_7699/g.17679 Transcript_7699/m.17679 type:complete len:309 (-) Transcript_7699:226-1152(-)